MLQKETDTHHVIRFEVADTGIGISAEDRLLLFERFSQIDDASSRKFEGIGLGLAAARQLVDTMGGLIDVESEPGRGSTFWFSVPFAKAAAGRAPIATSELDLKGHRVVLVDHLPTSRKIVRHYLEISWAMRCESRETGAEVLDLLRNAAAAGDPVSVVIFDALPDMALHDFAAAVRADEAVRSTRLVHLAGVGELVNEERMRSEGIAACLAKPVGQTELFDALSVALAHEAISLIRPAQQSTAAPVAVTAEMKRKIRVLLAEDNFLNRKLTLSQLEKLGYTAEAAANGKEVIEAASRKHFDIVLMDCQMPIVDGYEATMELRRLEKTSGRPRHYIVAMTANAREGDREKCLAAGMDAYLSKPTRHEDLEAAMSRFFAR